MSKYTEYVRSQSASEQLKADIYANITAQALKKRTLSTPFKAILSVSAVAALALAIVLPVIFNGNSQMSLRKNYSKVFANIAEVVIKSGKGSGRVTSNLSVKNNIGYAAKSITNERNIVPLKYDIPEDNSTLYGVAANVYFYSQLYLSENFVITDTPVKFTINNIDSYYYVNEQEQESTINYDVVLQASMDRKKGIVTSQMILREEQLWQSGTPMQTYEYLNLYVEYDFDKNKVISYTAGWRSVYEGYVSYGCYRYFDNILTELDVSISDSDYQIFTAGIDSLQAEFEAQGEQIMELNADFKEEYLRSELYLKEMLA